MSEQHVNNQMRILNFIKDEIDKKGYPPSVREIGDAVGLSSTSTVHGHLVRLEKKGLLYRDSMKPRAMGITRNSSAQNNHIMIPVVGRVAAGSPFLAEENIEEYISIPENVLGSGKHFILQVRGDSMINIGILDKDYVIVHQQQDAYNGDIVVAMLNDDSTTVKRYYKENGQFRLQPENSFMQPIYVNELTILGKVMMLFRKNL